MPGPVADDRVPVGQPPGRPHEPQRIARQVVLVDLPDDLAGGIDLDDLVRVAAGDDRVAAGQPGAAERLLLLDVANSYNFV